MPSTGDLIKITACSNLLSQQVCNVFYYLVAAWTGNLTLEEALEAFQDLVLDPINAELSSSVTAGTLEWRSIDNPAEVVSIPGGFAGGNSASTVVGSFAAFSFRMYGATAITRSGWKRIPGVVEGAIESGVVGAGYVTPLQAWADESLALPVLAPLPGGADMTLVPVIVGRNPDGTLNPAAVNAVTSVVLQPRMTTQNTRKVGRGS